MVKRWFAAYYASRKLLMGNVALSVLLITINGCTTSVCSKLIAPECNITACGCFDLVASTGGMGVFYDASDRRAVILRPDSTVEFYQDDTLQSRKRYDIKIWPVERGKTFTQFRLQGPITILVMHFEGQDSLWYGYEMADAINFLYIRHK